MHCVRFRIAIVVAMSFLGSSFAQNRIILNSERKVVRPVFDFEVFKLGFYSGYHKSVEYSSSGTNVRHRWNGFETSMVSATYFPQNSNWGFGINIEELVCEEFLSSFPETYYASVLSFHAVYILRCSIMSLSSARFRFSPYIGKFTSAAIELNHRVVKPLTFGITVRIAGIKYWDDGAWHLYPGYGVQIGAGITVGLGWWFTKSR
ncbi:MAG: hypothetical protein ABIL20_04470 [candidate division WOR-3 bacterium]